MSVKDFNRGVEAQARTHYAFMRKQGEATEFLGKRLIQKIDAQGAIVEALVDELSQQEMQRIFGVYESLDIQNIDDSDKVKLLGYLDTLFRQHNQNTKQQQAYYFAVKKYLGISRVSGNMNLKAVADLDITKSQLKAFFECVCEFLFLKTGTRSFLYDFIQEIECFGFNERIVEEIVLSIERTYEYFGIQGIVEHYNIEPPKKENGEKEEKKISIPYFQKPIVIVYSSWSGHGEERAKMLKICIHERLGAMGLECPVEIYRGDKAKEKRTTFERENSNIIYIGDPSMSKSLISNIDKWEFDHLGMKYATRGQESVIKVKELKKKQYEEFLNYAREEKLSQEEKIKKNLRGQDDTILATAFDDEPLFVKILTAIIGAPIILPSAILDMSNQADYEVELKNLQYSIAIDKFVLSKIEPFMDKD